MHRPSSFCTVAVCNAAAAQRIPTQLLPLFSSRRTIIISGSSGVVVAASRRHNFGLVHDSFSSHSLNHHNPPLSSLYTRVYATTSAPPPQPGGSGLMPVSDCIKHLEQTLALLSAPAYMEQLRALKEINISVAEKWNKAVWLLLTARAEPLKNDGFTGGQAFQLSHQIHSSIQNHLKLCGEGSSTHLLQKDRSIWELIFRIVFEKELPTKLELKTVRRISLLLCTAISDEQFTDALHAATHGLPLEAKNPIIIQKLQSLAMPIFAKFNLEGDMGYLTVQKALVDYSSDPFVAAQTHAYNHITTEAAGLN